MDKYITSVVKGLVAVIIIATSINLYADEIESEQQEDKRAVYFNIGFTSYYAWWKPVFHKEAEASFNLYKGEYDTRNAQFLYGPIIGLQFANDWSISGSYLYGKYQFPFFGFLKIILFQDLMASKWTRTAIKHDADLLISKQINKYLKIFFGPKYQGYNYKDDGYLIGNNSFLPYKRGVAHYSGGFGLGLGLNIPIVEQLYLLYNMSFQTLLGKTDGIRGYTRPLSVAFGGNSVLSLGYYIEAIRASILIGGRFQYLYYYILPATHYVEPHDMFYGVNVSLVFTL